MVKGLFRLLVGVFGAVLAALLSLQVAPGTVNTVVIISVAGFFVVLVILIMAGAMVLASRNQAESLVRISERALESQVHTVAISRASRGQLDHFLEGGRLGAGKRRPILPGRTGIQKARAGGRKRAY